MIRGAAVQFVLLLAAAGFAWSGEPVVVDFEKAVPVLADGNANRVPRWEEKGVVFTLAREPQQTKGKGMLMFFTHLSNGQQGNCERDGDRVNSGPCHFPQARLFRHGFLLGIHWDAGFARGL